MRVVVTARVRDEAHNVDRFCSTYSWADKILLADGGSVDNTKELASKYKNVEIVDFKERVEMQNRYWRNPHGKHINFVIEWAESFSSEWIIFDDFDSVPYNSINADLAINNYYGYDYLFMSRLYLWKDNMYFPKLSKDKDGNWTHALWAWRAEKKIRYKEDDPLKQEFVFIPTENILKIHPEYCCLLHYSWVDEELLNEKLKFYRESGQHPEIQNPLNYGGELSPLPKWVRK